MDDKKIDIPTCDWEAEAESLRRKLYATLEENRKLKVIIKSIVEIIDQKHSGGVVEYDNSRIIRMGQGT